MQENMYTHHPLCQESASVHHTESTLNDFPSFIGSDMAPMSVGASVPTEFHAQYNPLTPAIVNSDSTLSTVFSSTALNFDRVPNAALQGALSIPLRDRDYPIDAYQKPWQWFAAAAQLERSMHTSHALQTTLEEGNAAVMQLGSGQAPPEIVDLSLSGRRQTQPSDGHPVEAPIQTQTQPASHPLFPWLSIQPAGFPNVTTSPIRLISLSQAHYQGQTQAQAPMAGPDLVNYRMADPVLGQAPPRIVVHARRLRHRGAHTRSERVVCDQCKKFMRRQSLKRHIREVHDNIKRSQSKRAIAIAGFL